MDKVGSKRPLRWYVRDWREAKGLTQEQLAGRMGTNKGQVSKLERGAQRMNDYWISLVADALGIEPGDLLRDPASPDRNSLLRGLKPADQERVIHFAEGLKKTA